MAFKILLTAKGLAPFPHHNQMHVLTSLLFQINCDAKLTESLFPPKMSMFEMNKIISKHLFAVEGPNPGSGLQYLCFLGRVKGLSYGGRSEN